MFPKMKERRNNKMSLLAAMEPFEPGNPADINGTCGNIKDCFDPNYERDPKTGEYKYKGGIFKNKPFYEKVSAPYLLAKLVASYPGLKVSCEGQEGYKVTWTVVLKHKETGAILTFYDWKGAASYGSNIRHCEGGLKNDIARLLKALADPRFPHPYDGCVIGEIA